jgi:spore maturation protein CgeB
MAEILFVGALWRGSTSLQRAQALRDLGHRVSTIDTTPQDAGSAGLSLAYRVSEKLFRLGLDGFGGHDRAAANARLHEAAQSGRWDVLWLEKALTIRQESLAGFKVRQPQCVIAGFSPDDMTARIYQSVHFLRHAGLYDVFFTTKGFRCAELHSLGIRDVRPVGNSYDPSTHKPCGTNAGCAPVLGFAGRYEPERCRSIRFLVDAGLPVRVWGTGRWPRSPVGYDLRTGGAWGEDYAVAMCSVAIGLGFLTKLVREESTTRSVEIPACGTFLLAERTDEHLALFREGLEAEYFSSDEELAEKARYYLSHPHQRRRIAEAGLLRCQVAGYSHHNRLKQMIADALRVRSQGRTLGTTTP